MVPKNLVTLLMGIGAMNDGSMPNNRMSMIVTVLAVALAKTTNEKLDSSVSRN